MTISRGLEGRGELRKEADRAAASTKLIVSSIGGLGKSAHTICDSNGSAQARFL